VFHTDAGAVCSPSKESLLDSSSSSSQNCPRNKGKS
jgi:hypothetical protein